MELPVYHPFKSAEAKEKYLARYKIREQQWPVSSECRMVDTAYGQTFVRISGPMDAPPLVLMHGGASDSLMCWTFNIADLSKVYRTYAVDNIYDWGRSIYSRELTKSDDFVLWLDELLRELGLENNINLIGISYGGWISVQYALRFQSKLNKLVLLAPAATVLRLQLKFILPFMLSMLLPVCSRRVQFWLFKTSAHKNETTRRYLDQTVYDVSLASESFKPKRTVPMTVIDDQGLLSLKIPILYLVGENEKIYPPKKAIKRLNRVAPQIKTEIIPGAGHDLAVVQAELVNGKVLEFLKQ